MSKEMNNNDSPTKLKKFIIKQRSLSSLQSKIYSTVLNNNNQIAKNQSKSKNINQNNNNNTSTLLINKNHRNSQNLLSLSSLGNNQVNSLLLQSKNDQINILKRKLDTALNIASSQKRLSAQQKQQIFTQDRLKKMYQNKIKQLQNIIINERNNNKTITKQKQLCERKLKQLQTKLKQKQKQLQKIQQLSHQISILTQQLNYHKLIIKDLPLLKQRIIHLQQQNRSQHIKLKESSNNLFRLQKQIQSLNIQLKRQKPYQQQLKQKIAYLQRVNLDLSRKMEDYDRRQNQYIKTININKKNIKKLTDQRNNLQFNLNNTQKQLQIKIQQNTNLSTLLQQKITKIQQLQQNLQQQQQKVESLSKQIHETKQFFKQQTIQNIQIKRRNNILQQHEKQLIHSIQHFQTVNDQINLTIIQKIQQTSKLSTLLEQSKKYSAKLQENYQKFQVLFQDRTDKGDNQMKQFYYKHIRQNNKLNLQVKQLKAQMDQKVLLFGQQRDTLIKKSQFRSIPPPDQNNLYEVVYLQKNQQIILLQGSNDQLLKIKKQLQQRVRDLQNKLQQQRQQTIGLKLKAAQVFRAKKDLQQSRKTALRYQQMIQQQRQTINDCQAQLVILRDKITILNQKNFQLDLDNKNQSSKIKQYQNIMVEINADTLVQRKRQNDKNAHLIKDSLDRLQNGIKSMSFYFSCSFCNQTPSNSMITVASCGHNFCAKQQCKQGYKQFCCQCDTGMPLEAIFTNKYLKQAMSKFKFFKMIIQEVTSNIREMLKN